MEDQELTSGQKLVHLGDHLGLNLTEWAEEIGIPRPTLSAYRSQSKPANPKRDDIKPIAERFGVPVSWFFDRKPTPLAIPNDPEEAEKAAAQARAIALSPDQMTPEERRMASSGSRITPVWQGVVAGLNDECQFPEGKIAPPQDVPDYFFSGKDARQFVICLPVGMSMSPRITQGDKVVVRLEPNPPPNSIVIARREDGVNFIKVLRMNTNPPCLHSIDERFPPIPVDESWTCRGVVVGIWKPYIDEGTNIEFNGGVPLKG